jgi:hypothetical protein
MIIRRYRGYPVAVKSANGTTQRLVLVARALPSGCKATTPAEHRRKKQILEISGETDPRGVQEPTPAFTNVYIDSRNFLTVILA